MKGILYGLSQRVEESLAVNQLISIWNSLDASDVEESQAVETLMAHYGYTLTRDSETGAYVWDADVAIGEEQTEP